MKREYKIEITRDERWWMINVPEIDQLTQARRISEIEDMARSLIAISTNTAIEDITVHPVGINVPGIGDILRGSLRIHQLRNEAERVEAQAATATAEYTKELTAAGIPVRDVAELIGISPQRVSQLANNR